MELYVYSSDMVLQGIIEKIASLIWTRRYWTCGEFKLLVPFTEEHSRMLVKNNIIMKRGDDEAAQIRYGKRFSQIFKSITFDNGSEFADCAGIERSVYGKDRKRTKAYYCHPYSAYERGTNENINKMIRRFLPKGTDFRKVTAAYIRRVETWINNYPREILGFATASDLFAAHLAAA